MKCILSSENTFLYCGRVQKRIKGLTLQEKWFRKYKLYSIRPLAVVMLGK